MSDNETENDDITQHLYDLMEPLNSRARYFVESKLGEYNDSVAQRILDGNLELADRNVEIPQHEPIQNRRDIELSIREDILRRAEREKRLLEHKLSYINNSINSLHQTAPPEHSPHNASAFTTTPESLLEHKRQFRKDMQERSRKIDEMKKEAERKLEVKSEEKRKQLEQHHKEEVEKRKQDTYQRIQKIKQRMADRQIELKDGNDKIRELLNNQKVFEKLEASFQIAQVSLLEQRKRKLSEIRKLYKPIDHEELISHQQRFLEYQQQRQEMRERERKMSTQRYEVPYESIFYKRAKEKEEDTNSTDNQAKAEKVKQFAEHIKDNFRPEIDLNKKRELEEIRKKQAEAIRLRQEKEKELLDKPRKKGLEYLHNLKNLPKLPKSMQSTSPKALSTPRTEYKNYITHTQKASNPWKRILNSSQDGSEKAAKVYYQSLRVQESLKRKEEFAKLSKSIDTDKIDQEYYEMIRAKLSLLS